MARHSLTESNWLCHISREDIDLCNDILPVEKKVTVMWKIFHFLCCFFHLFKEAYLTFLVSFGQTDSLAVYEVLKSA